MNLPPILELQKITAEAIREFTGNGADNPEGVALLIAEAAYKGGLEIIRRDEGDSSGLTRKQTKAASSEATK